MEKLFKKFHPLNLKDWNKKIENDLKGMSIENLKWHSPEGITIDAIYHEDSISKISKISTHSHSDWEIEQFFQNTDNSKILNCLNKGVTSIYLDKIKSEDLNKLLKDVLIQHIQTCISSDDVTLCALQLKDLIKHRKLDPRSVRGSFQFDPLIECLKSGSFKQLSWNYIQKYCDSMSSLLSFQCLSIQAQEYHNAGANIIQELAYSIAQASDYYTNLKGLRTQSIQLSMATSSNYFFEIAKYRSARILWSQLQDAYGFKNAPLNLRAETSLRYTTLYDSHVNMLRATSQCMSAALGGVNTIMAHNYNYAIKKEDELAQRISRNISLILKEEAYLNKVSDPGSGSYYIEYLTNQICDMAWKEFQKIESMGGWMAAVKSNYIQNQIEKNAKKQMQLLESGELSLLGTNLYPLKEEKMNDKLESPIGIISNETREFKNIARNRLSIKLDLERLEKEVTNE